MQSRFTYVYLLFLEFGSLHFISNIRMRKMLQIVISIFILYATIEDRAVHGTDSINYAGGTIKY